MHFIFGFLFFFFFVLRRVIRWSLRKGRKFGLYGRAQEAFENLTRQYGGDAYRSGWRKLIYVTADRSVEIQVDTDSRRLVLRLRKAFPERFSFYRLPRLLYAFLEAFFESRYKLDGTQYLIGARSSDMLAKFQSRPGFLPLMQKMSDLGFSGQMGQYGLKLSKHIRSDEISDIGLMSYIRLAQDLAQLSGPEYIHIPVQQLSSEKHCAYCKEIISETDPAQYCQSCGTPHHKDCFELNGKCTVYGCAQPVPQRQEVLTT
jgi:hypothetical protein